jgi:hypothetical protein
LGLRISLGSISSWVINVGMLRFFMQKWGYMKLWEDGWNSE